MLNIGITYNPSDDLFTSGSNQTSILLVELFQTLQYNVTLVNTKSSDDTWWKDFPKIQNITLTKLHQAKNLDLFIDIDGFVNPSYRKSIATKSVVFLRSFLQFVEMDNSVYPENSYRPRDFEGVSEIWCWDIFNPPETLPSIQTLFPCPIRLVPFIWSSSVAEFYSKGKTIKYNQTKQWNVHIAEKNTNNTSSSIIPLVAIRELHNKRIIDAKYKCHNMDKKIDNQFLKENILNNIEISSLPVEFCKKQSFYEWLDSENTILFSHTRFLPLRIGLINAVWMGLPIIHNSPIIQKLHPQLERLSYFGNEITNICSRFSFFTNSPQEYYNALGDIRNKITEKWSISNNLVKWTEICSKVLSDKSLPVIKNITSAKEIVVAFSEMWGGFNWNNNFFTDALRQESKINNLDISIKGVEYESINYKPDIIIFGPFTNTTKKWKNVPSSIPKIFFSAENWGVPTEDGFNLHLTPYRAENEKHMRLPTWMIFIDWFNDSLKLNTINTDDNPNRMPLSLAMNPHTRSFKEREDFCAFVVSNPISQFRNETFKALDSYKRVNSGGELYNNIGGRLGLKYPGGGCGDIPKYDFFSKHKFSLSFENSQASGYITEKVLHAKMAGCVPLYWGDKDTDTDFVPGSFINLSQLSSPEQIIKVVEKLEENPEMCAKIAATPILNEEKKQKALEIISKMSRRILEIVDIKIKNEEVKLIDKIFVINLDTRKDRWDNLMKAEPYLENKVTRISAVNGKNLKLNTFIYKIFKDNKFFWKKSVIGCFLSHLTTWTKLLNEPGDKFLILEDDVRFDKEWISTWNKAAEHIPKDAELLYFGGVLPPNKGVLSSCLEEVNQYWSQIKPNNFFSPHVTLPIFHFCAYSYIITKTAAQKLLGFLTQGNMPINELDHFIGHPAVGLNKYILNPLITHCFQEEDSNYVNSQFNDLKKTNNFDSDIWNNTESFTIDEIEQFKNPKNSLTVYHIDNNKPFEIYEQKWLEEVLNTPLDFKPLTNLLSTVPDNSWFIVQRPHLDTLISYFHLLKSNNINFKVIHLSDEFSKDSIDFYSYSNCKVVIRNYIRDDIPKLSHIITIPLGFHHKGESSRIFDDRSIVWSFHGTNWFNRKMLLEPISSIVPNNCHFTDTWNDPKQTLENCYLGRLNNSKFCPILRGNNVETFRLYEALESGSIPLYVRCEGDDKYWKYISSHLELVELTSWEKAAEFIKTLCSDIKRAEEYRSNIVTNWQIWKNEIKSSIQKLK
jgi:GR25 family glycosyltransferase involved in LPS biosynthesis